MSTPFVPFPDCKRHVLASETACPFCRSALPADLGPPRRPAPVATGPFARAAIFFMGAATTACSSSNSAGEPVPSVFYGPAVFDASMQGDSGEPMPVVFYGPAFLDASLEEDTGAPGPGADASPDAADAGPPTDASAPK
jgi:hypothetical protein